MRAPTLVERIRFHRVDSKLIGFEKREGWRAELPVYEFRCSKHGVQRDYPHGYKGELRCGSCASQ